MKKVIYFTVVAFISSIAHAGGDSLSNIARQEVADKISAYSGSMEKCKELQKPIMKSEFSNIDLTNDQLKTVLKFHMSKANFECSKKEINDYLLSSAILSYIDSSSGEGVTAGNELITHDAVTMFKLKQEYLAIPEDQRELVESIPGLKKPFHLVKTAQNLGL